MASRGEVPLARRQLAHEPAKLVLALLGVTLAVALVGLLFGRCEGIGRQVSTFVDNAGADVYVASRDTRSLVTAGPPALRGSLAERVAREPGVERASALVAQLGILRLHEQRVATLLIGFDPGGLGAPWSMSSGRAPARDGEVALDRVMADAHGLEPGDTVTVRGRRLRVVGLTARTSSWMTPLVFVTRRAASAMNDLTDAATFVLARTEEGAAGDVARRIDSAVPNVSAMTREELAKSDRDLMVESFSAPLLVMVLIALAVGALVIAITTYGFVAERRRELGSLKAIGARNRRLYRLVSTQALAIAAVGLVAGIGLQIGAAAAIESLWPKFLFVTLPAHYALTLAAAVVMGLAGALVPARVLARLDPAEVFRR